MHRNTVLALGLLAAGLLIGGAAGDEQDLEQWVDDTLARPPGPIEPLPQIKTYETVAYERAEARSPFVPDLPAAGRDDGGVRPDATRKREYLEGFPLDTFRMVGTLYKDGQLYGRLARLFVAPLLRALSSAHDDPLLSYLSAFRYPLAGEFAFTADAARSIRAQRAWGLEIGMLGEAYDVVGETATAQVDLGMHRHDHRPVGGRGGLSTMAQEVGEALFRVLEDHGLQPDYERLPDAYRDAADTLVRQYGADAAVNGLSYDHDAERSQVQSYAESIRAPGPDDRLPAWTGTTLSPTSVLAASRDALGQPSDSRLD